MPQRKTIRRGMFAQDVVSFRLPEETAEYLKWCAEHDVIESVAARMEAQARRVLRAAGLPDFLDPDQARTLELTRERMAAQILIHADELRRALARNDTRAAAAAGMRLQQQHDLLYFRCLERPFTKWQKLGEGGKNKGPRWERRTLHEQWRQRDIELQEKGMSVQSKRAATIAAEVGEKAETVRGVLKKNVRGVLKKKMGKKW
jgi:hypothetical protein